MTTQGLSQEYKTSKKKKIKKLIYEYHYIKRITKKTTNMKIIIDSQGTYSTIML